MTDKISERELNLIKAEAINEHWKNKGIKLKVMNKLLKGVRKAVEDDKKIKLAEASNPNRKNWQDNIWLHIAIGILIAVIAGIILKYVFNII